MKNLLPSLILLLLVFTVKAQTITGRVFRAGTDTTIASATVYYGGSMTGTSTDNTGNFTIPAKQQQIPLIVSCVGYYNATVNYEPGKPLIVNLKPKIEQLKMVTIHAGGGSGDSDADGMTRKNKLAIFIEEFIGTSDFANSCTISNIDDVELFYNKKKQTLTASSDKPLIIVNKQLGYTISYFLDKFEKSPDKLAYVGNYIFRENEEFDDKDQIKKNREKAYVGSRLQFIRALWRNDFASMGYKVFTKKDFKQIHENNIVRDSSQQKYLHVDKDVYIIHQNNIYLLNTLKASTQTPFISKDGYYGAGLQWSGGMGKQRVGDLLPYEFQSEKDPVEIATTQNH